jgi:hypothetical protein
MAVAINNKEPMMPRIRKTSAPSLWVSLRNAPIKLKMAPAKKLDLTIDPRFMACV